MVPIFRSPLLLLVAECFALCGLMLSVGCSCIPPEYQDFDTVWIWNGVARSISITLHNLGWKIKI
jgi:hypothetical protein